MIPPILADAETMCFAVTEPNVGLFPDSKSPFVLSEAEECAPCASSEAPTSTSLGFEGS